MALHKSREKTEDTPAFEWRSVPIFVDLHAYWQSLRQDEKLPRAENVDLLALLPLLPELSLLDMVSPDEIICRFAGTAICDRLGFDLTGRNICEQQASAMRDRARRAYDGMASQPCGMIARYVNHYSTGSQGTVSSLYLPLITADGSTRILGIGHREEKADYAPPIDETLIVTDVLSVDWLDIGFGVPASAG